MKIRKALRGFVDAIADFERFLVYVGQLAFYDTFKNYIKKEFHSKDLVVLVNGPSLKDSIHKIISNKEYEKNDLITVNFMVNDDTFYVIKPKCLVISDYTLFHLSIGNEEKVVSFFDSINNKVNWELTIYVTYSLYKDKQWRAQFRNPMVKLIPIHSVESPDSITASYWLHRLGWLGANYGSVLHHAIYVGMLSGYKKIYLYGADHTFFDGLCVDDENRVCRKISHFYDDETEIRPIYHIYTGERKPYKMSYFLMEYQRVFLGHDILRYIADRLNVKIINKTPVSLIDSYERQDY